MVEIVDLLSAYKEAPGYLKFIKVFGSSYGTLEITQGDTVYEMPVYIGALDIHDSYLNAWQDFMAEYISNGEYAAITFTGFYHDGLPVIEVMDANNVALSHYAIENGWALPSSEIIPTNSEHVAYVQSLFKARSAENGMWGDNYYKQNLTEVVPKDLLKATQPELHTSHAITSMTSGVFMLLIFIYLYISVWSENTLRDKDMKENPEKYADKPVTGNFFKRMFVVPLRGLKFVGSTMARGTKPMVNNMAAKWEDSPIKKAMDIEKGDQNEK